MANLLIITGFAAILVVVWDAFETIVLPRRVARRFRLTRAFYRATWVPASAVARRMPGGKRRERYLGVFGPLSLIMLLVFWALGLIFGFTLIHWASGTPLNIADHDATFGTYFYLSGTTFFTLGFGDITPVNSFGRMLAVCESGTGFGLLAIVIGYLPVMYQAFSRREVNISMLDARAGSPPSAFELLRRHNHDGGMEDLDLLLRDWERWAAELLESHLSYPVLCFFRSQHDNQSWLAALTTILDTSALVIAGIDGKSARQAQLTFAMARHAVVDLAQIFNTPPCEYPFDRLPASEFNSLQRNMLANNIALDDGDMVEKNLAEIRKKYEPYVKALADYLLLSLPPWSTETEVDNWQKSAWDRITGSLASAAGSRD